MVLHIISCLDIEMKKAVKCIHFSHHMIKVHPLKKKKWHSFLQAPFVNSVPVSRNIARRTPEQLSQYYLAGKH